MHSWYLAAIFYTYHQTPNVGRTLIGNKIVDHSDVVGAAPVTGIILCMRPANGRWRYIVTPSLIGWAHTQNAPCCQCSNYIFHSRINTWLHGLGKDKYEKRREIFKVWDLVRLIFEVWREYWKKRPHRDIRCLGLFLPAWLSPCLKNCVENRCWIKAFFLVTFH